ncbi:unnamed protein product [Prunus armeniaca]
MMKLSYHGVSTVLPITSGAGAVVHAHHLTFLEVHTCVIPGLFCTGQFHPRVLLKDVSTAIQLALSHTAI